MPEDEPPAPEDAELYDLSINGRYGKLSISKENEKSQEVVFVQTNLEWAHGTPEVQMTRLLDHLDMFREFYPLTDLKFDELLQRDIDDFRITTSMIPYLLGIDSYEKNLMGTVENNPIFFPPVIAIIVPITTEKRPEKYYPGEVYEEVRGEGDKWHSVSQKIGTDEKPIAEFSRQQATNNKHSQYGGKVKVNTNNCQIVIIDGQHRAMSLLALHRNLANGWDGNLKRQPFKHFYSEWNESYLKTLGNYDFSNFKIPMIVCGFPSCVEANEISVKDTARSLFITLNKEAKKPTESRRVLLEDKELIARILRNLLESVQSGSGFPIYSIQLEGGDIASEPVPFLTFMQLRKILCYMLLRENSQVKLAKMNDVNPGRKHKLTTEDCPVDTGFHKRLAFDFDTDDETPLIRKKTTPEVLIERICANFESTYGRLVLNVLTKLKPFSDHHSSTAKYRHELTTGAGPNNGLIIRTLFDGIGMYETMKDHLKAMTERIKTIPAADATTYENITSAHEAATENGNAIEDAKNLIEQEKISKASNYLIQECSEDVQSSITSYISQTTNLQILLHGLIQTPAYMIEETWDKLSTDGIEAEMDGVTVSKADYFSSRTDEYIRSMNKLLTICGIDHLNFLVSFFIAHDAQEIRIEDINGTSTLTYSDAASEVPYCIEFLEALPAEPLKWPKFMYIISRCWETECTQLATYLTQKRDKTAEKLVQEYSDKKSKEWKKEQKESGNPDAEPTTADVKAWKKTKRDKIKEFDKKLAKVSKGFALYNHNHLKKILEKLDLPTTGNKNEAVSRLESHVESNLIFTPPTEARDDPTFVEPDGNQPEAQPEIEMVAERVAED